MDQQGRPLLKSLRFHPCWLHAQSPCPAQLQQQQRLATMSINLMKTHQQPAPERGAPGSAVSHQLDATTETLSPAILHCPAQMRTSLTRVLTPR